MAVKNTKTTGDIAENVSVVFGTDGSRIISDMSDKTMTDDVLRGIDSFEAALAAATEVFGDVLNFSDEMGNGFRILQEKSHLIGKRCVFMHWRFSEGDHGVFVSAAVVTTENEKFIVNDGSTGICADLMEYSARTGRFGGMVAPNGLRVSEYPTCNGCNAPRPSRVETCNNTMHNGSKCGDTDTGRGMSTTYYVDLSA